MRPELPPAGVLFRTKGETATWMVEAWVRETTTQPLDGAVNSTNESFCLPRDATHVFSPQAPSPSMRLDELEFMGMCDKTPAELRAVHASALKIGVRRDIGAHRAGSAEAHGSMLRKYVLDGDVDRLLQHQSTIDWDCLCPGYSLGEWMYIAAMGSRADATDTTLPMLVDMAVAAGRMDIFELIAPIEAHGPGCMEPVNSFILEGEVGCLARFLEAGLDPTERHEAPLSPLEAAELHQKSAALAIIRSVLARRAARAPLADTLGAAELHQVARLCS